MSSAGNWKNTSSESALCLNKHLLFSLIFYFIFYILSFSLFRSQNLIVHQMDRGTAVISATICSTVIVFERVLNTSGTEIATRNVQKQYTA